MSQPSVGRSALGLDGGGRFLLLRFLASVSSLVMLEYKSLCAFGAFQGFAVARGRFCRPRTRQVVIGAVSLGAALSSCPVELCTCARSFLLRALAGAAVIRSRRFGER